MTLTPIHSLLVHFALLSLHYLVVADELDFDVVIQVLKKKLCPVTDLSAILSLPLVVLESFVLLLGDGECGSDNDDDDDQNNVGKRAEEKAISSHVKAAVQALIHIVNFLGEDSTELESTKKNTTNREMVTRVKANAFQSLSRYSLRALGITEDGLHASIALAESETDDCNLCANETSERYFELRDLIVEGLETLPSDNDSATNTS
jgi:hypothetical protein